MVEGVRGTRQSGASAAARAAAGRFAEVLRAARRRDGGAGAAHAADRRGGDEAAAGRATARRAIGQKTAARSVVERGTAISAAAEGVREQAPGGRSAGPAPAELGAAIRALPAAVEAARVRDGAQVSLAFGSALGVDLRSGPGGLELSLRPAPSLERAAAVELPRLVEAIRARGLRVARAEVRTGAGRAPAGGGARVDGGAGLR